MGMNNTAAQQSNRLAEEQFRWNQDQARKSELDAQRQRAAEQLRQGRITDAVARLNAMFDGGKYQSVKMNPRDMAEGQNYYDAKGNPVQYITPKYQDVTYDRNGKKVDTTGMNPLGHLFAGGNEGLGWTQRRELVDPGTQGDLYLNPTGAQEYNYQGFNDDFFKQRANPYFDYYKPQVDQQFGEARTTMKYGMADAGILNSSVANTDAAKLARDRLVQEGTIKSKGELIAGDLRQRVNQVRSNLLQQIQTANDPNQVMQSASAQLNQLRADPIQYDALGQIFATGARTYGAYQNGQMYGGINNAGGGGVPGGGMSKGSGKTVNGG